MLPPGFATGAIGISLLVVVSPGATTIVPVGGALSTGTSAGLCGGCPPAQPTDPSVPAKSKPKRLVARTLVVCRVWFIARVSVG
jgi:hypothetical protein